MEVLKYPDPRLRTPSEPVVQFDSTLHRTLDSMATTLYGAHGIGLAGAQVGFFFRVFIVDIEAQNGGKARLFEFINPEWIHKKGSTTWKEGCLSIPGLNETVKRAGHIAIKYQNRFGERHKLVAEELLAVAIQHEYDHLDGVLFIDHLSFLRRYFVKRKLQTSATMMRV